MVIRSSAYTNVHNIIIDSGKFRTEEQKIHHHHRLVNGGAKN